MSDNYEPIWVERYRPKTVSETILPKELKQTFQHFVDTKDVPLLLLSGRAGVGKTTVAKAMLNEIGADFIMINGSNEGRLIETLRTTITNYASTMSLSGGRKYIIIDEADYMNAESVQPALRSFIEEFSSNCGFIFTCNLKNRIIEPLRSRCSVIDFDIPREEKPKLASQFFKRATMILDKENVSWDQKALVSLIQHHFPDWRRVINELQRYSSMGSIDDSILTSFSDENINTLIDHLKNKKFTEMRQWVAENSDIESAALYRILYDVLPTKIKSTTGIANAIFVLAEYQFKEAFVANPEINRVAALANIMADTDWK
jgi:DNA polymerase III delta prime subunit